MKKIRRILTIILVTVLLISFALPVLSYPDDTLKMKLAYVYIDNNAAPESKITKIYIEGYVGAPEIWKKKNGIWVKLN